MNRKDIVAALLLAPKSFQEALADLLYLELESGREEMESARDEIAIWRAQGRVQQIQTLLRAIKM